MNAIKQSIFSLHIGDKEPAQLTPFPEEKRGRSSNIELLALPLYFQKYIEMVGTGSEWTTGEKGATSLWKGKVYPLIMIVESFRIGGLIVVTSSPPPLTKDS